MAKKEFKFSHKRAEMEDYFTRVKDGPVFPVTNTNENKKYYFRTQADASAYIDSDYEAQLATPEHGLVDSFDIKAAREMVVDNPVFDSYVLSGSTGNFFKYKFYTLQNESQEDEPVYATYKISNSKATKTVSALYGAGANVSFNLDRYLADGTNTLTLSLKGRSTGTSCVKVYTINVLALTISSSFSVANNYAQGDNITVRYTATGSKTMNVDIIVDGVTMTTQNVDVTESGKETPYIIRYSDMVAKGVNAKGNHTLQLRASIAVDGFTEPFYSKMLFYEFTITGDSKTNITIAQVIDDGSTPLIGSDTTGNLVINAEQYVTTKIPWGFYLGSVEAGNQTVNVNWRLIKFYNPEETPDETSITSLRSFPVTEAQNGEKPEDLKFVFNDVGVYWLQAMVGGSLVKKYKLVVVKNTSNISEVSNPTLRLLALGRSNGETDNERDIWQYKSDYGTITTTFNGVQWNSVSGWHTDTIALSDGSKTTWDSLQLGGGATATVNLAPFGVGGLAGDGSPTSRGLTIEFDFETYNVNEEDAVIIKVGNLLSISATEATLQANKINEGSFSSSLTTNYAKGQRIKLQFVITPDNLETYKDGQIMYIQANGVLDRINNYNSSENFTDSLSRIQLGNAEGKSGVRIFGIRVFPLALTATQNYNNWVVDQDTIGAIVDDNNIFDQEAQTGVPDYEKTMAKLPTLMITGNVDTLIKNTDKKSGAIVADKAEWTNPWAPQTNWTATKLPFRRHGQSTLSYPVPSMKFWLKKDGSETHLYDYNGVEINKGRWAMKTGGMPLKKYILQAFYVDSSCCKSPSILNIITSAYLSCQVNGEYVLRTPPQKFALEQYNAAMKAVHTETSKDWTFPYTIRTTPDSLPCAVFWQTDETSDKQFLGMMVLMDDKKSDYLYGERSIYSKVLSDGTPDPFDFYSGAKETCLWDNKDVCRFEILENESDIVFGKSTSNWWAAPTSGSGDNTTDSVAGVKYQFENSLELIYPDLDDIHGADSDAYLMQVDKVKELYDWYAQCYNYYTQHKNDGGSVTGYEKFWKEADQHLNIYFWAAYFKICMDNGLFDNICRNMQLATYGFDADGNRASISGKPLVWYPLFWDCDCAYGVLNNGKLAFGPRVTRQTYDTVNGYAFSSHNSFIWDAFEAWTKDVIANSGKTWNFITVLQQVTNGMNNVYNFSSLLSMQEDEYCGKWPEQMYNQSEWYKYGTQFFNSRADKAQYLTYLQGRGELYRAWWMATNIAYWNAKLCAGTYTANFVEITTQNKEGTFNISLTFAEDNYFGWAKAGVGIQESGIPVKDGTVVTVKRTGGLSIAARYLLYACQSVKEIDIHEVVPYITNLNLGAFYDETTGSCLKVLNIGLTKEQMLSGLRCSGGAVTSWGNLTQVNEVNIQGWTSLTSKMDFSTLTLLTDFKAGGASLQNGVKFASGLSDFYCELPDTITTLTLEDVKFRVKSRSEHSIKFISSTTLEECDVPYTLYELRLIGMGKDEPEAKRLVIDWLDSIDTYVESQVAGLATESEKEARRNVLWSPYKLQLTGLYWENVTYAQLELLGRITTERIINVNSVIKIADTEELTSQQMTKLQQMFGDNCFKANNGTLCISYNKSLFVVTATGDDVFIDASGNYCVYEGCDASLGGFVFPLTDDEPSLTFYRENFNDALSIYKSAQMTNSGNFTSEEQGYPTYDFTVRGTARAGGVTSNGETTIKVMKRGYPKSVVITPEDLGQSGIEWDETLGKYIITAPGHYKFNAKYLNDYEQEMTASNNVLVNTQTKFNGSFQENSAVWSFSGDSQVYNDFDYSSGKDSSSQICLYVKELGETEKTYPLSFSARFKDVKDAQFINGTRTASTKQFIVYSIIGEILNDDAEYSQGNIALFNYVQNLGITPQTNNNLHYFSSKDIKRVGLVPSVTNTLEIHKESGITSLFSNVYDWDAHTIKTYNTLNYMTNVGYIDFSDSSITPKGIDLSGMGQLLDFTMEDTTTMAGADIDVTRNSKLYTINMSGTESRNINGTANKNNLNTIKYAKPTKIVISGCPNIKVNSVSGPVLNEPIVNCTSMSASYSDGQITLVFNEGCNMTAVTYSGYNSNKISISSNGAVTRKVVDAISETVTITSNDNSEISTSVVVTFDATSGE